MHSSKVTLLRRGAVTHRIVGKLGHATMCTPVFGEPEPWFDAYSRWWPLESVRRIVIHGTTTTDSGERAHVGLLSVQGGPSAQTDQCLTSLTLRRDDELAVPSSSVEWQEGKCHPQSSNRTTAIGRTTNPLSHPCSQDTLQQPNANDSHASGIATNTTSNRLTSLLLSHAPVITGEAAVSFTLGVIIISSLLNALPI